MLQTIIFDDGGSFVLACVATDHVDTVVVQSSDLAASSDVHWLDLLPLALGFQDLFLYVLIGGFGVEAQIYAFAFVEDCFVIFSEVPAPQYVQASADTDGRMGVTWLVQRR